MTEAFAESTRVTALVNLTSVEVSVPTKRVNVSVGLVLGGSGVPGVSGVFSAQIIASEALSAGDLVNIWTNTIANVRRANATAAGREADGFVLAAVSMGVAATVYFGGALTGLSGLTPGAAYFLATSPGGLTLTAPAASGNIDQPVGKALSATTLAFARGLPVELS